MALRPKLEAFKMWFNMLSPLNNMQLFSPYSVCTQTLQSNRKNDEINSVKMYHYTLMRAKLNFPTANPSITYLTLNSNLIANKT